jgi:hypothetical protein
VLLYYFVTSYWLMCHFPLLGKAKWRSPLRLHPRSRGRWSALVSFTQYPLPTDYLRILGDASSDATGTVPYALLRTMKCNLYCVFPLLLVTSTLSLPSSWPYRKGDGLKQAAFQVQGLSKDSFREWELPPNPNSTHHLLFNSVSGFLQRWPNTFRRNGALDRSLQIHRTVR